MNDFWTRAPVGLVLAFLVGLFANKVTEYWTRLQSWWAARRLRGKWTAHKLLNGRAVDRETPIPGSDTEISAKPCWKDWGKDSHVLEVNGKDPDGRRHSGLLVIDTLCPRLATRIILYSAPSDEVSEQQIIISHDRKTLYIFPVDTAATMGAGYDKHALCHVDPPTKI